MFNFMFGVLGSLIFWSIYIVVSFFMALIVMKKAELFKDAFRVLSTGSTLPGSETKGSSVAALIVCMIIWPIIVAGYLVWLVFKVFIGKSLWWIASSGAKAMANKIPDVKITFGDEEKKEAEAEPGY
jgi:hypothetical protein